MSVVFVVVPTLIGGWPMFMAAVAAACSALGYRALASKEHSLERDVEKESVALEMPNAQLVSEAIERDQTFTVTQGGVTITFSKDARGRCAVHVDGQGKSQVELAEIGQQVMNRVMQQYAYNKVTSELEQRGFNIVQEQVDENNVIRIRVRRPG